MIENNSIQIAEFYHFDRGMINNDLQKFICLLMFSEDKGYYVLYLDIPLPKGSCFPKLTQNRLIDAIEQHKESIIQPKNEIGFFKRILSWFKQKK